MADIIFGAGGQLGYALRERFPGARAVPFEEVDIADEQAVAALCDAERPQVIFNAAAYPNTEKAEHEATLEAYRTNVLGAVALARAAAVCGATLVHVSTDYVFDGDTETGFDEASERRPLNIHGLSKAASEDAVRAYAPSHYIIRTSALFGPREGAFGNNFVTKRIAQLEAGQVIRVVDDQWTTPTYTCAVADALGTMIEKALPSGVYHVVGGGGAVTWYAFACAIQEASGIAGAIEPCSTGDVPSALKRGRRSVLIDTKLARQGIELPDWRASLAAYLRDYRI